MPSRIATWELCWAALGADTVEVSHRWVVALMRKRGQALVKVLWRILGNEADVCDAYQDTFLQLATYGDRKKLRKPEAFMFRTASNIAISMLRRRQVRLHAVKELGKRKQHYAEHDHGAELDARHLTDLLRANLARLPEQLRNVIVLKDLAEMPYGQVASILGLTPATARVYRCRGIQLLGNLMMRSERGSAADSDEGESNVVP